MLPDRTNNITPSMVYNKVLFKCKTKKSTPSSIYKIRENPQYVGK